MKKILWIDNDELFNKLLGHTLNSRFKEVQYTNFTDGNKALVHLNLCLKNKVFPNLIFVDLNMPGMGGIEFLEIYDKHYRNMAETRVFVLTSSVRQSELSYAKSIPCVEDCLTKPLTSAKLNELLSN